MFQHLSSVPKLAIKDRLLFRLGLLFCVAFMTVFVGGLVYDLFQSLIEQQSEEALSTQPAVVSIDPKIESELTEVLSIEPVEQNIAAIKDPFTDRSGISNTAAALPLNTAPQQQSTAAVTTPIRTVGNNFSPASISPQTGMTGSADNNVNIASPEATISRMRLREQRLISGQDAEPESSIFAIEDMHPVGIVSGGDEQQEVMFYSQALDKTFSFPVGSRFYDGVLIELRPEGVAFSYSDTAHTLQLKPWEHSLTQKTTGSLSLESSPNLALQSKDN